MECPNCGNLKTTVSNSRKMRGTVFRQRKCKRCGHRFYTEEWLITDDDVADEYLKEWYEIRRMRNLQRDSGEGL